MKAAFITLSPQGYALYPRLLKTFGGLECFLHESVAPHEDASAFAHIQQLTETIFPQYQALIYAAPCGVVTRALAACLRSKLTDPAVVALDVGARWCVSLLSGHEGGANDLAIRIANVLGAEPVITTTTEAVKDVIVGVGCRRGTARDAIVIAIRAALDQARTSLDRVRLLASADVKADEPGLWEAAEELHLPLRFISSDEIRACLHGFAYSAFVQSKVGIPAVAEPAALLAGRRTTLLLPKTKYKQITVALARENCMWSESAPEIR